MFSSFDLNAQERLLTNTERGGETVPVGLKSTILDLNLHPAAALHRGNEGGPLLQDRDLPTSR